MKILRISLRNLASLAGKHTVDFTREPLRSAGLFSICGPTGSGKSTLLDALCLALYDDTPRLSAATGSDIPDSAKGKSLTQRSSGNILRRGAAEGFAEVAFVGVDSLTYTARWEIRRAGRNADGALQAVEMSLFGGNVPHGTNSTLVAGGRKTEVLNAIVAKVGLSFDQFTRAVLLAQNDFAVFLKSADKDRGLILEALTGTERFARISVAVFERNRTEVEAVAALKSQLASQAPLDPALRTAAEADLNLSVAELAATELACNERDQHLVWFQRQRELALAAEQAAEVHANATQAVQAAAPRRVELDLTSELTHEARPLREAEQRELTQQTTANAEFKVAATRHTESEELAARRRLARLAALTVTEEFKQALDAAQPALTRARALDAQLDPLAKRLAATQREHERAELATRLAIEKHQIQAAQITKQAKATSALITQRDGLAPFASFSADAAAWTERITAAQRARDAHAAAKKDFVLKTAAAAQLAKLAGNEAMTLATQQGVLIQYLEARTTAEQAVQCFDPEALAAKRRTMEGSRQALGNLQIHFDKLTDLSRQSFAIQTALGEAVAEIAKNTQALDILERTNLPAAKSALASSEEALAVVEAAADKAVPKLRESLRPQTPCPVCGSEHHPYATHAPTLEAGTLRALRAQVADKRKTLDTFSELDAQLTTAIKIQVKHRTTRQADHARLMDLITVERTQHSADAATAPLLALPEAERAPALVARLAQLEQDRLAVDAQELGFRQAAKALAAAREAYDKASKVVADAERRCAELARQGAAADTTRDAASGQATRTEEEDGIHLTALEPLLEKLTGARGSFAENAGGFSAYFNTGTTRLREVEKQLAEAAQLAVQAETQLAALKEAVATAEANETGRRHDDATVRTEHDTLRTERKTLFAGRPAADVARELEVAHETAARKRDEAALVLSEAEKALAAAAEALRGQKKASEDAVIRCAAAQAGMDIWFSRFSAIHGSTLDRDSLAVYLARDDVWIKTERAALDTLAAAVQTAVGACEVHARTLVAHDAARPTMADEATARADLSARQVTRAAAKQRHIDHATILSSDDHRRQDGAALLERLTIQQVRAEPWAKLNELVGSAEGAKFRAIAQRRTLDLLLGYANAQLDILSARYRLERIPESLNLIVCDRDMADERRSVHSLSGGESFLVSLALALGLASLTSNRLRIESLFIDEGFGSLDPETLNIAINALMQLESQGRKVGVISHVSEMADVIPVRVQVLKGRAGASRLSVSGVDPDPADEADDSDARTAKAKPSLTSEEVLNLAHQLTEILQREKAAGKLRVSVTALRRELNCEPSGFTAVRDALGGQLITQGKSLGLS